MSVTSRQGVPPLVCGIDESYVVPLRALMQSLVLSHLDDHADLRLIVLHQDLSRASQLAIRRHAQRIGLSAELREVPATRERLPVSGWISEAVYLRLAIGEMLADEPTVLYLDADVLVMRSLRPLMHQGLEGAPLAAVQDPQNPLLGRGIALPGWRELGVPEGREYFNSGVMLMDLAACRKSRLFARARQFLTDHPRSARFWDQDALNWAAQDQWLRLERTWNTFALSPLASRPGFVHHAEPVKPLHTLLADEQTAAILHFAGPDKPWKHGYPGGRLGEIYQQFLPAPSWGAVS